MIAAAPHVQAAERDGTVPRVRWRERASRFLARAVALAETRSGMYAVFVTALAAWWIQALVIPLGAGRDLGTYVGAYVQLFQSNPVDLGYVLGRTPIAALGVGGLLDLAGGRLAEPAMSLLYAASTTAWFIAARRFGGRSALATAVVLLLYPGYAIIFHELSSDAVFAAAFAGWSLVAVRVCLAPSPAGFALLGTGIGVLALIRPGNQALLVLVLLPLIVGMSWRRKLVSIAAFVVPAVALVGGWVVHNGIVWDDYTLARNGNATVPFFRAFTVDHIVGPDNGPASRELAAAVQRDLLPKQPYRAYGIDLHRFFAEGSPRMQEDLIALSNRLWGWHSDSRKLREVGMEAVRAHPLTYARGVAKTTFQLLSNPVFRNLGSGGGGNGTPAGAGGANGGGNEDTIVVNGRRLPKPTKGDVIPAAHEGGVTTPDNSIYTVWTSATEHHLVFVHMGQAARYDALHARMDELQDNLPSRSGSATLALRFNQSSRWYPRPFMWLAIALACFVLRRPRDLLALVAPTIAGFVLVLLSAAGLPAEPHYSVPIAPAFVLLAAGALFGPRRQRAAGEKP
jgi:hypothetical protein